MVIGAVTDEWGDDIGIHCGWAVILLGREAVRYRYSTSYGEHSMNKYRPHEYACLPLQDTATI